MRHSATLVFVLLQHTATHSSTQQRNATYCNSLHKIVIHCWMRRQMFPEDEALHANTATHRITLQRTGTHCNTLQLIATHCNTLQHTASHCNSLHHTAIHRITLKLTASLCCRILAEQLTASYCNTPYHTATPCNTPHHTATHYMTLLQDTRMIYWHPTTDAACCSEI